MVVHVVQRLYSDLHAWGILYNNTRNTFSFWKMIDIMCNSCWSCMSTSKHVHVFLFMLVHIHMQQCRRDDSEKAKPVAKRKEDKKKQTGPPPPTDSGSSLASEV